ncbi:hypothetical protein [Methylobacterium sp. B1]|uniref:hypothetical protein n=1 Tax=Methylobacterium sp. B1 TaxID=91459 RepID=UPI000347602A|nr:hypothetical protein [Methylobacterium sp. B1]
MIKREHPLVKRPLADRPYDVGHPDRLRSDGTHKPFWDYRGAVIEGRTDTERGYFVSGLGIAFPPYATLSEACDRIDEFCNRRGGQHRRFAQDLAASVAQSIEAEPVDFIDHAEQPILPTDGVFVDSLGFSIGPVTVRNLVQRAIIDAYFAGYHGDGFHYDDMADELVAALARSGFEIVPTPALTSA